MADLPSVKPEKPAEPRPAGMRPALSAVDVLSFVVMLLTVATFAIWGFLAWETPWNIVVGIAAPIVALLIWALFVSPRAVIRLHPYVRALVELLLYAAATVAWWSSGQAWIGIVYAVIAVAVGLFAGLRRLP